MLCQIIISDILKNNNLPFPVPTIDQLTKYLYNLTLQILAKNYPERKLSLKEACKNSYHQEIDRDEMFFIENEISQDEVSLLFTTKALINNLIKQCSEQPSLLNLQIDHSSLSTYHH